MKLFFVLVSISIPLNLFSQITTDSVLRYNFLRAIGKRLSIDKRFEFDKYGYNINGYRSVTYLPARKDSINYAGINLGILNVLIKHHKIKTLTYEKNYSSSDSVYIQNKLNNDFESLARRISADYNTEYKILGEASDSRSSTIPAIWKIKKHEIRLTKSYDYRRSNGKFCAYLMLLIQ